MVVKKYTRQRDPQKSMPHSHEVETRDPIPVPFKAVRQSTLIVFKLAYIIRYGATSPFNVSNKNK